MIVRFGADPMGGGMTGDEFAWAGAAWAGDLLQVVLVKGRGRRGRAPFDLDATVWECCQDVRAYGAAEILGDRYSAGWVVEAFRRHGVLYRHSERTKSELYLDLLPLLTRGAVELPPDPELLKQLKLLERRRGAQGKDVVDHPQGAHDDRATAVALAAAACGPAHAADPWKALAEDAEHAAHARDPRLREARRDAAFETWAARSEARVRRWTHDHDY